MTRDEALKLLHKHMQNENLRRHCYAVEATMRALAKRLGGNEDTPAAKAKADTWGIAGLLHDVDYEKTKDDDPHNKHTKLALEWLNEIDAEADVRDAIAAHGWNYVHGAPEPDTSMQWALYTCDELTGLIVACALVKPEKTLASVNVDSVLKKWNQKSFAAGVDRKQIELCEERLDIPLRDFIQITLTAMQEIHQELGL